MNLINLIFKIFEISLLNSFFVIFRLMLIYNFTKFNSIFDQEILSKTIGSFKKNHLIKGNKIMPYFTTKEFYPENFF